MNIELIREFAKQAAFLLPEETKKTRKKLKKKKTKQGTTTKDVPASNRQSPHRYGRKLTRK